MDDAEKLALRECPMFRERSTYFSDGETTRELDIDFDGGTDEKKESKEEGEEERNGPFFEAS